MASRTRCQRPTCAINRWCHVWAFYTIRLRACVRSAGPGPPGFGGGWVRCVLTPHDMRPYSGAIHLIIQFSASWQRHRTNTSTLKWPTCIRFLQINFNYIPRVWGSQIECMQALIWVKWWSKTTQLTTQFGTLVPKNNIWQSTRTVMYVRKSVRMHSSWLLTRSEPRSAVLVWI